MKKEVSNSRRLRRRLLAVLVVSLLTVVAICTVIFERIYNEASKTVTEHSAQYADKTVNSVSDAYYQLYTGSLEDYVYHFCLHIQYSLLVNMPPFIDEADFRQYLLSNAKDYFADAPFCEYVFVTDGSSLKFESFKDEPPDHARTQELSDEIDSFLKNDPYASLGYDSLQKMLQERARDKSGMYCKQGKGFALAFSNMKDFSDYDCYIGLVMYDANSTLIAPVKETTSEEANVLINEIDGIFERYIYILLGSVGGVLVVFIVISAVLSKVLADPVVSEHDMLVQVNEMKTAFLSDASHELKTPLAAMSGYAQNAELELDSGADPEAVREKLKRISSEANRMALMVTQILDATRIEEGRMVLEYSPCEMEGLVREVIETYFAVLNKNNNRLVLRIPIDLPPVQADSSRLKRVFVNLISNALKHTKNGTILLKAEDGDDGFVTVTVKDTGSGISEEDMPHIWERYYKGKHSETGTGLGLFICKFIVESHGGKIWAQSTLGEGTSFMFTLPKAGNI